MGVFALLLSIGLKVDRGISLYKTLPNATTQLTALFETNIARRGTY